MARLGSTPLYHGHDKRPPNTFCNSTTNYQIPDPDPRKTPNTTLSRNGHGYKGDAPRGIHREMCFPFRFFIKSFPGSKGKRKEKTCFKSQKTEPVPESETVSSNKLSANTKVYTGKRLHDEGRSKKRVFSYTSSGESSSFPSFRVQRAVFQHDLPTLRHRYGSSSIFSDHELDSRNAEIKRGSNSRLLRRLFTSKSGPSPLGGTGQRNNSFSAGIRLRHKCGQNFLGSYTHDRILRYRLGLREERETVIGGKGKKNSSADPGNYTTPHLELARGEICNRKTVFRSICSASRTPSLSQSSDSEQHDTTVHEKETLHNSASLRRSPLVAREHGSCFKYMVDRQDVLSDNRCVRLGLGSSSQRHPVISTMGRESIEMALQSQGALGSTKLYQSQRGLIKKSHSPATDRQSDSRSVYKERRRDEVTPSTGNDQRAVRALPQLRHNTGTSLCTGTLQHRCRSLVQGSSTTGLVPLREGEGNALHEVGNPGDRSFCNSAVSSSESICQHRRDRSGSRLYQCIQPHLESPTSLAVPTTNTDSQGATSPELGCRSLHPYCSTMGQSILASGHQVESLGSTNGNTESATSPQGSDNGSPPSRSRQVYFGGLEGSGWEFQLSKWREQDIELLQSSWRASTLKSYKSAWNRWREWTKINSLDSNNPTPESLARFLCYLSSSCELAPKTVALHKSVVATFSHPGQSEVLSSSPIVRRVMKAIQLKKPTQKQQTWDVSIVIEWMLANPPKEDSLFEISRYVALMLVLSSGRRIHDLTLLRISNENMERRGNSIIFWPVFGSKTDSVAHRQSGWQIKKGEISFDPVFWIEKLIQVSNHRRNALKNEAALFISTRGQVKAASRAVIAGWIRTAFKAVGIEATPGSVRSAVSSNSWENNLPIEDLLARGNWKSSNTFFKYYYKEIERASKVQRTSTNFLEATFRPI